MQLTACNYEYLRYSSALFVELDFLLVELRHC